MNLDRFRKACDRAWQKFYWGSMEPPVETEHEKQQRQAAECMRELHCKIVSEKEPAMPTNDSNTYFKLFQSKKNKQWYFSIHGGNHRIIAQSEGYKRKASAEKAIANLQREVGAATVKE